jgi:hypothetical protein
VGQIIPALLTRVARRCDAALGIEAEWVQPIVMTACCSGMLVAALALLIVGV